MKHAVAKSTCAKLRTRTKPGMKSRTPWRVKLERPQERRVVPISPKMQRQLGQGTVLIPKPLDVDEEVRRTTPGQLLTVRQIREHLAERYGATTTCPLCAGIFLRIAAEAAEEEARKGAESVTPWWRVVGEHGELNPKMPGGIAGQARHLREEGHTIARGRVTA